MSYRLLTGGDLENCVCMNSAIRLDFESLECTSRGERDVTMLEKMSGTHSETADLPENVITQLSGSLEQAFSGPDFR